MVKFGYYRTIKSSGNRKQSVMIQSLFIFGTRPEAIKLCPVIRHMKSRPDDFDVRVCVTAQHREMLDQVLRAFDVTPDRDLDIMRPGQTLSQSTSRIIAALEPILADADDRQPTRGGVQLRRPRGRDRCDC